LKQKKYCYSGTGTGSAPAPAHSSENRIRPQICAIKKEPKTKPPSQEAPCRAVTVTPNPRCCTLSRRDSGTALEAPRHSLREESFLAGSRREQAETRTPSPEEPHDPPRAGAPSPSTPRRPAPHRAGACAQRVVTASRGSGPEATSRDYGPRAARAQQGAPTDANPLRAERCQPAGAPRPRRTSPPPDLKSSRNDTANRPSSPAPRGHLPPALPAARSPEEN